MACGEASLLSRIIRFSHEGRKRDGGGGLIAISLLLAIYLVIIDVRTRTQ